MTAQYVQLVLDRFASNVVWRKTNSDKKDELSVTLAKKTIDLRLFDIREDSRNLLSYFD